MASDDKPSFWSTLPGVLTGAAAFITALATAYGVFHHAAPESGPGQKHPSPAPHYGMVTLQGWEKSPGLTGIRAALSIDGTNAGLVDNLTYRPVVPLGRLKPGPHRFALTQVTGFEIGPAGSAGAPSFQNGTCSNQFEVSGREEIKSLTVRLANNELTCRMD